MMIPAHLIQLATGSQTWKLDDKTTYPNILRTNPSNEKSTTTVVQLLKSLNDSEIAKVNSFVLIHTNSEFGQSGAKVSN